jgi:hypothetical protein
MAAVFFVGVLDLGVGLLLLALLHFKVCLGFSTFLELHYDTPWAKQVRPLPCRVTRLG